MEYFGVPGLRQDWSIQIKKELDFGKLHGALI